EPFPAQTSTQGTPPRSPRRTVPQSRSRAMSCHFSRAMRAMRAMVSSCWGLIDLIGECVNQGCPDHLADGAHLAFAVQHPLAAPHLERHVAEAGALRAQVNRALDIVRPVGGKERADRRLSAVFAV